MRLAKLAALAALVWQAASGSEGVDTTYWRSFGVSSDGRFVAFLRVPNDAPSPSTDGTVELTADLWLKDTVGGRLRKIAGVKTPPRGLALSWSPDRAHLAYLELDADSLEHLRIWDRQAGRQIGRSRSLAFQGFQFVAPRWLPDGRRIAFVSSEKERPKPGDRSAASETRQLWEELRGYRPSAGGKIVLSTAAIDTPAAAHQDAKDVLVKIAPWRIVVLDVNTGAENIVASGTRLLQDVQIAPDGLSAVAVIQDEPNIVPGETIVYTSSFFQISLTGEGRPLRRIAGGAQMDMYGQSSSLSPSGTHVAYVPVGLGEHQGDVYLVDIASGETRNLTASFTPPLQASGEWRLRGKFGAYSFAPIWVSDAAVLALHGVPRAGPATPHAVELWRIATDGSGAAPTRVLGAPFSVEGVARCEGMKPCLTKGRLIVKVRDLTAADNRVFYAALEPQTGKLHELGGGATLLLGVKLAHVDLGQDNIVTATQGRAAIGYRESPDMPPEFEYIDMDGVPGKGTARSLRVLNPGPIPAHATVRKITWTSDADEVLNGALILPPGLKRGERPPVIVYLYWASGEPISQAIFNFGGRYVAWNPLLEQGRYAVLVPELPEGAGDGKICDRAAVNATAALDAAVATGLVDGNRAGAFGYSRGGGLANCIATRTDRFKAIVAGAGFSDWTSQKLLYGPSPCFFGSIALGGCPWEAPQNYLAESPVFHLDKVGTPLYLFYGKNDAIMLVEQMIEMYNGLAILGKPAQLVAYDGREHQSVLGHPDAWPRIIDWYRRYFN